MRAKNKEGVADHVTQDWLFTWKPGPRWPHDELRKLVQAFQSVGTAEEPWSCRSYKQIQPGDRAYLLKQGKPIGIFGRGTIIGKPQRKQKQLPNQSPWEVLIGFDVSRGDILCDPGDRFDRFFVSEKQMSALPAPQRQWNIQAAGMPLKSVVAREIDKIIDDSILLGRWGSTEVDETAQDIVRRKKFIEQSIRPDQQAFRETIRRKYGDTCPVTRCITPAALEAAHISTKEGSDDNSPVNGILLRSDIHALFDRFLITLTEDGTGIEISPELNDSSYAFLRTAVVTRPDQEPPSAANIGEHRSRFFERQKRRSGDQIAAGK
jgi:hypothetical protein